MYVAIVSDSLSFIEYSEEREDYRERAQTLDLECMARGGDWRVVTSEAAFHFPTAEEIAAAEVEAKVAALRGQLSALDYRALRATRAVAAGTATDEDRALLAEIEAEAVALRAQLKELV